jgi:DNA-binding NarL/FixJ family response regulator
MASLADADLALDAGDAAAAADHALAAAGVFESVNALWDAARARAFAGRAFIAAGESVSGTRELELAAAAFDSFGATRYRDQAERELRKLGHHLHRRSRAGNGDGWGLGSLTERELEVAHLVVDRRTNREIAAELFLSEKTVEAHLRNIFNKVGVERRRDLAVVLTQPPRRSAVLTG